MADVQIVGKAMDDLADDWHWLVLVDAQPVEERVYYTSRVRTKCGLLISGTPRVVRLFDMGAPDAPTCPRCLDGALDPSLRQAIEDAIESGERVGAPA